jgi:aspartate aminotransferase
LSQYFGRHGLNSAADVARNLLHEAHVAIVPGEAFGSNQHARLSYPVEEKDLERGLERMRQFFASL